MTDVEQKENGVGLAAMALEVNEPSRESPFKTSKPLKMRGLRGDCLTDLTIYWDTNVDPCS
jgi:hypothetical protein